jgi:hypothetical protein
MESDAVPHNLKVVDRSGILNRNEDYKGHYEAL